MYTILKTLNNNIAQVTDNDKNFIVFGKGIAYGKKIGDTILEEDITQWYFLGKKDYAYFMDVIGDISPEIIYISELIIKEAKQSLNGKYNANLLLMIADHLNFAVKRSKEGIVVGSPLEYEIRRLYQKEIIVGEKALEIIKKEIGVCLPKEEITMIALHLVNSQVGNHVMQDVMKITEITNNIFNIINFHYQTIIDETSTAATRFMIHLRYFILKYLDGEQKIEEEYEGLYQFIIEKDARAVQCLNKIMKYLDSKHGWIVSENDQIYLLLHINRLIHN
ncbi:MAG: PRD domain-containing protein [Coprobacillaceae bacterium]